ncbi:hypothetical protein STHU_20260 [Allostella humosa]|nr:hypothetical protein STHU_20260 [Stella humosa]
MVARPTLPEALRRSLAGWTRPPAIGGNGLVALGAASVDAWLGGGIPRAALHEVFAERTADVAAATGFALAIALRSGAPAAGTLTGKGEGAADPVGAAGLRRGRGGGVHPPGLAELGLDPGRILLVRARDGAAVLRAAAEGARCPALAAVLIQPWGEPRLLDLTATRRLSLAAAGSGVLTVLLRAAATPAPSAAATRWAVLPLPSHAGEGDAAEWANAPGRPAFAIRLLRHRGGVAEGEWRVEWNRDQGCFEDGTAPDARRDRPAPLPRPVVPLLLDRPAAAGKAGRLRRAG